jgi:hypothetical protein
MTAAIFSNYIDQLNKRAILNKKKILLLVDNVSSHKLSVDKTKQLTHLRLEFLPPNCTSVLQPLDAGIINSFKSKANQKLNQQMVLP